MTSPEGIVSWRGWLLKEGELDCEVREGDVLGSEASRGSAISDAAALELSEELLNQTQTLADSSAIAYALRGEKLSEPARQAARFVIERIPGDPGAGRWWTISSALLAYCRGAANPARRDFMRG